MITHPSSISISAGETGKRLDLVITSYASDHSRAFIQRLIEDEQVLVNGRSVKKHYRVKKGDDIAIAWREPEEISIAPDPSVPFRVVYDGPDFAVVEKPAGVVMHPSVTHKKGTLVNGLLARWPEIAGVGDPSTSSGQENLRPGIVHRLDKETSGLLVVAKTQPMFLWLKKQFQDRMVEKRYIALAAGIMKKEEGEIDVPIARGKGRKSIKQIVVSPANTRSLKKAYKSRKATTGFKILHSFKDFTLVEAAPKTGRMHQIRVHFAHIGHPVAGDKKYASKRVLQVLPMERHFLHAAALSFPLPDGTTASFSSELPPDLTGALKGL